MNPCAASFVQKMSVPSINRFSANSSLSCDSFNTFVSKLDSSVGTSGLALGALGHNDDSEGNDEYVCSEVISVAHSVR